MIVNDSWGDLTVNCHAPFNQGSTMATIVLFAKVKSHSYDVMIQCLKLVTEAKPAVRLKTDNESENNRFYPGFNLLC